MASYTTDTPRHVVEDYLQKNGGVSTHHISETQRSSRLNQVRETGEPENASYRNHDGNGYHHGDANMSNRSNNRLHQTYPSNDGDYSQRQRGLSLEYGKTIKLLRNGDEFFNGQKVVINSRKYRYFDVFLDDVSSSINARFGAVRSIHTPIHGHRIKSLDQIEDGKTYVANGGGRFVKLNYMDISEGKRVSPARLPNIVTGPAADFSTPLYDKVQNVIIYVYRNGDVITPPARILLHKNTLQSYDAVFNEISNKVTLTNGPILKLFTLEGESIITPTQLTTGSCYVAASKDRFKRCEYYPPNDFSPRLNRKSQETNGVSSSANNYSNRTKNSQPASITSSNASTSGKSNQSYPGKPYTGWHKEAPNRNYSLPPINDPKQRRRLNIEKDENSSIYNSKPVANKNEENSNQPQHKPQLAKANSKQQPQSPNAKKESTVDEAASKIQASFRGHDARETQRESERAAIHQPEQHHDISEEEAATKIQSVYRGYTVRTKGELAKQKSRASLAKEESVDMTVDEAATVVQSHYRGEVDRQSSVEQRQPEQPRHEETMSVDEAAVKIQSQFRGHEARTESPKQNEQTVDEAATVIQSHFRGVDERQQEEKPIEKNEEMSVDEAATKIQSSFRGHEERRDSKQSEQEMSIDQAATEVQSSFRGHVEREEAKETKENDSYQLSTDEAATKIQSAYRSYKTRQETRDNIHQENQHTAADPSSGLI